jgi:SAM-dependent methyltransferase
MTKEGFAVILKGLAKRLWRLIFRASPWEYVQRLVIKVYLRKYETRPDFREWLAHDQYCRQHTGHSVIEDEMVLWQLRSQLFELTTLLKDRLNSTSPQKGLVLDAGASDGLFLDYLGLKSGVGVNILQECVAQIKAQGHLACRADLEDLPFAPKSFAAAICLETLEHVPNPVRALSELARVCFGTIHISIPHVSSTRIHPRSFTYASQATSHIFEFSPADFPKVVSHALLRITYSQEVRVFPGIRNPFAQVLLRRYFYPSFFPKLQYYELEPMEASP